MNINRDYYLNKLINARGLGMIKILYFILLDEVQLVSEFVDVLNSLLHIPNAETYVTGSNSKFLSKDVVTEIRGRGWEIRLYPLSFKEFMSVFPGDKQTGWEQYIRYGGLPQILNYHTEQEKQEFLQSIWQSVYLSDVVGRYKLRNKQLLDELLQVVASQVGSSVNPTNLSNTFRSLHTPYMTKNKLLVKSDLCFKFMTLSVKFS